MMKFFLSLILIITTATAAFAQFNARLDRKSSVVFPSKPKEMQQEGQQILYSMLDRENKVTAMATAIDASQYGVDSGMIAANYNNTLFVDLILQNITGQYSGMRLESKKKIAVGKLMGYDVLLVNDAPSESVPYKKVYAQVFFAGSTIYAMTVLSENESDDGAEREKFFRSLKVD
jgi:anti-sigma28 factor (negative regulator of flagellin synthesis)